MEMLKEINEKEVMLAHPQSCFAKACPLQCTSIATTTPSLESVRMSRGELIPYIYVLNSQGLFPFPLGEWASRTGKNFFLPECNTR